MKAEDIEGLTPAEIQEKFALPTEPKYGIEFYVNPGETIRTGEVNPLFGKTGKGQQFDCIGKFIGEWGDTWELPQN